MPFVFRVRFHLRFALIQAVLTDMPIGEQEKLLQKHFPDRAKEWDKPYMYDVLSKLSGENDGKEYEDLKLRVDEKLREEFIYSRVGASRTKAAFWTPKAVKALKPEGSVLVWQIATRCYQGYYQIPESVRQKTAAEKAKAAAKSKQKRRIQTHWSRSRSYGEKRTQLKALVWIVNWLWQTHKQQGHETRTFLFQQMRSFFHTS